MLEKVKQLLCDKVSDGREKVPVADLVARVARQTGIPKRLVKQASRELVAAGELRYTYIFGTSFLEPSFDRPVRVSKRIVLRPPDKAYGPEPGEVVVTLAGGASFGNGAHPTTCLALQALDSALSDMAFFQSNDLLTGLDVGTGTGVLAIAMGKLGVQRVVGTDIDPCAIFEARHNVSLNGLSKQVTILDMPVERLTDNYTVILANLACPTLKNMSSVLAARLGKEGLIILSGFKKNVSTGLAEAYSEYGLSFVSEATKREWVCMTLVKKGR